MTPSTAWTLAIVGVSMIFCTSINAQNPLEDTFICGQPECKAAEKFNYKPGTRYNYKYAVNISSLFVGTSTNASTLYVEGDVHLDFISHCDGILTLSGIKLRETPASNATKAPDQHADDNADNENRFRWSNRFAFDEDNDVTLHANSRQFAEEIGEHAVRFAFHDGLVTEVCPYEEEKAWVLNFKKGVLSMLHNTMRRFDLDHAQDDEQDVRGACRTRYRIGDSRGTSLIVAKTKELDGCASRSKLHSMIQSTPYNFRVNYKGKSLLKSSSECELSIDHKIYNAIECEERHVFEPFAERATGASTIVRQRLTLLDEYPQVVEEQPPIERRLPLLYDHVPTPKQTSGELRTARDLVKKLCHVSADEARTEFSDLFTKFIHTARLLSSSALTALYEHAGALCPTGKKHLLDALPFMGSDASITLTKDIILEGGVSEAVAREWMMSVALVPLPTPTMLSAASALLEHSPDPAIILAVSSLTHTYCKQHAYCRDENISVDEIITYLEDRAIDAYQSKDNDRETREKLMVALKALTNIGVMSESFKDDVLRAMIEDRDTDVALRVAAVDAHRRLPCDESRAYFEEFFRNTDADAEVRIAAYLQVMRCPNYIIIRTIKHSLEYEEVNQVGSFIWSHLHNLLKSSIPSRVEIQSLLTDRDLTKKFSSDARKFSHNYEGSIFFEEYNVGGNYESNVIFSPASYIPRSGMLNVTVDLFGESINLLEVYGRLEGFEHYAESLFGPRGDYSAKNLQDKIPKMRWARSVSDGGALADEIDKLGYTMDNDFKSPKVALGMKLFGNELKYATFNGDEEIRAALDNLDPREHLKRLLSGREINYNKAAMFLDTSYVVPSGAGLPVTLNAVGTTSINLQLKGSLAAGDFLRTKEMDVGASISPSVAVDIVGSMSVDAYFASTGIKLKTSMHTSTAIEAFLKIRGLKLVSVKFGLPKVANEIFGVESELIVMKGSGEEEQQAGLEDVKVVESACTWPTIDKTLGLSLCVDYHFANVTDMPDAPHFLVAGPAGVRVSLKKSDPAASIYLLEYKWEETPASSYMSLTLDTPESNIPRIMGANLSIDKEGQNLTLLLRSTEGVMLARGKYKNTDAEKYIQLGLDINNQKNFDALLSLERKEIKNGWLYEPKLYLGINEERVAELQGSLKLISKAGISQYDVDLKFKTKRLASKLFGYVSLSRTSATSALKLNYKFVNTREHVVLMDLLVARRVSPNIEILNGNARIESTAYPHYNFNSTVSLQRAVGHILLKGLVHSSPHLARNLTDDPEMLTLNALLMYRALKNGTHFHVAAAAQRPSTELDVRADAAYDQMGYRTDARALVRYARDKDVIVAAHWFHPRQTFALYEGRLNVTIPTFKPAVLDGKLKEKTSGDYTVELECSWFSGHKLEAKGLYQDRSTDLAAYHHLKLLVRSPSFAEINADSYYYRNNTVFKIDVKADQNDDQYALNVLHSQTSAYEVTSSGRLVYKGKLYSISSLVSLKEKRQISLELHIDQMRDIYLALWAHNKERYKEAGVEVKWDANRDPNQKLVVTAYYVNERPYNYDANFQISYPGRTIMGNFIFILLAGHIETKTGLYWSADDALSLRIAVDYENEAQTRIDIESLLVTPFQDWRRTSLNGGFSHAGNMYRANGSVNWQHDQHVAIDLYGDYAAPSSAEMRCAFTGALDSTVGDIPSLSASLRHEHNATRVETEAHMMYEPKQKIAVTSAWQIDEDAHAKNLTGTMMLVSPFKGFHKGLLVGKICVTSARDLRAVANIDFDHREFAASVAGHFQKLSRASLNFNITTPIEKFKELKGRFGFSEQQRHAVAQIEYPSGKTGIEVRLLVVSMSNFDVLFTLATPLEFLQEVLIVGKLQPANIDFRVGYNRLLVGFAGRWHFASITDVDHSYKVYTPIDGFEENGAVARLIFKEGLDFEVSVRLAASQLGVIVQGKPKPKLLKELGIRTQAIYNSKVYHNNDSPFIEDLLDDEDSSEEEEEEDDEPYEEEEDPFNWSGYAEVHTILYPSVTAEIDVDQKGSVYDAVATLYLPAGRAVLRDEFDFGDVFNIRNHLSVTTPYGNFAQLTSNFEFRIMMGHQYLLAADVSYRNGSEWIKTGALAHYFHRMTKQKAMNYNATFHVHTPFELLPLLDFVGGLHRGQDIYRTNLTLLTTDCDIVVDAGVKMRPDYIKGDFDGHIDTQLLTVPESSLRFEKDFTASPDNRLNFYYTMLHNKSNDLKLESSWRFKSVKDMQAHIDLHTPFKGMESTVADVEVDIGERHAEMRTNLHMYPIGVSATATRKDNELAAVTLLEIAGKTTRVDFDGTITKSGDQDDGRYHIEGVLRTNAKQRRLSGTLEMGAHEMPKKLEIDVHGVGEQQPNAAAAEEEEEEEDATVVGALPLSVRYEMRPNSDGDGFVITQTVRQGARFATVTAHTNVRHRFDWDLHLQIETSHQIYKTFVVKARAAETAAGANRSLIIDARTPFERLETIRVGAAVDIKNGETHAEGFYDLGATGTGCNVSAAWSWLLLEDMRVQLIGNYRKANYRRDASVSAFYVNPAKAFTALRLGTHIDLNNAWIMSSNVTMERPEKGAINVDAAVQLPRPSEEWHHLKARYRGGKGLEDIEYAANYRTLKSKKNYGSSGNIQYKEMTNLNGDILVEWDEKHMRNALDVSKRQDGILHVLYRLNTPKFTEDALVANISYAKVIDYHNATANLFYPASRQVGYARLYFKEFANMRGFVNASTPFHGLNYTAADFTTETTALVYNRYVQVYWPHDTAFVNATCTTVEVGGSALERDTRGIALAEFPLTTRHQATLDFNYHVKPLLKTGHATVEYNKAQVLEGKYNCASVSRAGYDKDTIHVELENKLFPLGADYVRSYAYDGGDGGGQTEDGKSLKVYHLHNASAFDVTGRLRHVRRTTGQYFQLAAVHANRTVTLTTDYDVLDHRFTQYTRLEMGALHWLAYDFDLVNETMDDSYEAQRVRINLSYPRRNFTTAGSYNVSKHALSSTMSLRWHANPSAAAAAAADTGVAEDNREKYVEGGFAWLQDELRPQRQTVLLELKHPSLEKNVTIHGEFDRRATALADVRLTVDYSPDEEQQLNAHGVLENHSDARATNYTYGLWASHPATNLQLDVRGGVHYAPRRFYSHHYVDYKRSYLPTQSGEATTRVDVDRNEIEMKRKTQHDLSYLWGRYAGAYPLYTANVSAIHEDINATGEYYLNFDEKLIRLELNLTEDGSRRVHMLGFIPDARSAYFDLDRHNEDKSVSDVSYFLKLNHSRLVVGHLQWRPELKQDIKDAIRAISVGLYNLTMERSEYWRAYIRSETSKGLADIWTDAQPQLQEFLDDVKDLRVIEEDLDALRIYLNDSYNANEFYVKDAVSFAMRIIDDLALRKHIESLPAIVNEIWEVMGDSGDRIQKSVAWIIDKIKEYYKKAAEFINALFQGDTMAHLTDAMMQLVEKYDNAIKDMHVAFIRYMEQLWTHTHRALLDHWHRTLAALEPKFITLAHYIETILWNASTEVLDFLYIRNSDIIDNPYVSKISNLSHDVDRFYKDITGNDTIGSTIKYSKVVWEFLKEKYFKYVPFGREVQDIVTEIVNEVNELKNLPSARFLIRKYEEIEAKLVWFYQYFDVEHRLHRLVSLLHAKLSDMKQTALQADNRYREAKTKFVFEPADGVMHLEQKLPMSWHAFNETPKFQEIPEYKMFYEVQNFFSTSRMTFANFYYDYKPYTDPMDWFPPFRAQAMLIGGQHYVTFDGRVFDFENAGGCTYLLAGDFLDGNFSIAVTYKDSVEAPGGTHEMLLLVNGTLIRIDMYTNTISLDAASVRPTLLPLQVGAAHVYQEADIVTVEADDDGFQLQCNMQLDICTFEVSGWYFGKTAGLWGTMNNEPYDDLSTPNKTRAVPLQAFVDAWSLDAACTTTATALLEEQKEEVPADEDVAELCYAFYASKVSPFESCFDRVPAAPFAAMCARARSAREACQSGIGYMKMCAFANTPLRIPDACVKCNLPNGTDVDEGTFVTMANDTLPPSVDVVFIVEAKECNRELRTRRRMEEFVTMLDREINSLNYHGNRYAAVAFGGNGVLDAPRSIVDKYIFTSPGAIPNYFDRIQMGNGSVDIFAAIAFASSKLIFRPGVSKAFVLLPCSDCKESNMTLDFTTIHQLLLENDIALHILMNDEFRAKKATKIKTIFGMDRRYAYAKKDVEQLKGDKVLRKSVQLPKASLGVCAPLSLETNGSLFAGKKLDGEKSARKVLGVFAKRVAQSAVTAACKTCECTADNSGVSYMECLPCHYPSPLAIESGDEDEMLAALQPHDDDLFDLLDSDE